MTAIVKNWHLYALIIALVFAFGFCGASREGLQYHMMLNIFSWFVFSLLLIFKREMLMQNVVGFPFWLLGALCVWVIITLLPLPVDWFPDKRLMLSRIGENNFLGTPSKYLTISNAPAETIRSFLAFGPGGLGLTVACLLKKQQRTLIFYVLSGLGVISICLGFGQIFLGPNSEFYLWEITNRDSAVGVFSNANHQTIFAVILLCPITYYCAEHLRKFRNNMFDGVGQLTLNFVLFAFTIIGVTIGGSLGGYLLFIVAIIFSIIFLSPQKIISKRNALFFFSGLMIILGAVLAIFNSPRVSRLGHTSFGDGDLSRIGILAKLRLIIEEYGLTGTGFGSFEVIYPFYEDLGNIPTKFVPHAHNDWLEWYVELGLPGLLILFVFVVCVLKNFIALSKLPPEMTVLQSKLAALSVTLLGLHSLIDYPLRTPFLALVFATMLGMSLSQPKTKRGHKSKKNSEDLKKKSL